jgi:hypothetical protein
MGTNYYVRRPPCENPCTHCQGSEDIHLGKASAGWAFVFQAYPVGTAADVTWDVSDFGAWLRLLDLGDVFDEYGAQMSRDELIAMIDNRRGLHSELHGHDFSDDDGNVFIIGDFS